MLGSCDTSPDAAGPSSADAQPQRDPDFSPTDTYLTATVSTEFDAVIQSATPMADATTGQTTSTMTIDTDPVQYAVEAGYAPGGTFVFNQTTLNPSTADPLRVPVDIVQSIRVRNGRMEFRDAVGQPILGTGSGQGPELQNVLSAEAANGAVQLVDGVVLTALPATGNKAGYDGSNANVTSVSETGDLATVVAQVSTVEQGQPAVTQRRIYRHVGTNYVLQEVKTDFASTSSGIQVTGAATVRFANVAWSRNAAQDQARASGTGPSTWSDGTGNIGPYIPPTCDPLADNCEPPQTGGGTGTGGTSSGCAPYPGGANIIYQHGFLSSGSTWGDPNSSNKIRGRARCLLQIGFDDAYDQANSGLERHASQTTFLQTKMTSAATQPVVPNQVIIVGHSQGGLISRRVAQNLWNPSAQANNKIRAVVTIGTPHQGANIARNLSTTGLEAATGLFNNGVACRIVGAGSCFDARSGLAAFANGILALPGSSAAVQDLVPGSPAMTLTNGVPETFPRFGIQNYIPARWAFARVAGDILKTDGGPAFVTAMNVVFWAAVGGGVISSVASILTPWSWGVAVRLFRAAYEMDRTDRWYNRVTAGSNTTDGIVEGSSQKYPGIAELDNFRAVDPTSHLGETNTQKSYVELQRVLVSRLAVLER